MMMIMYSMGPIPAGNAVVLWVKVLCLQNGTLVEHVQGES